MVKNLISEINKAPIVFKMLQDHLLTTLSKTQLVSQAVVAVAVVVSHLAHSYGYQMEVMRL